MKNLKKYYKWIIILLVIIIISVLIILIGKNLFNNEASNRLDGIDNYKITKNEINFVKDKMGEIDAVESTEISTNYKIIKIFIQLNKNIDFDEISEVATESVNGFSEENLKFYDIEIFIDCLNEECEVYPKIGYKHKSNSEFSWNR